VKILVVGGGAVGSLFGARLTGSGNQVEIVGRPLQVEAIRAQGLTVEGTSPGTFRPTALRDLAEATTPDLVLLAVKTFDLTSATDALGERFKDPLPIVLPQNGLHVEGPVAESLAALGWMRPDRFMVRAVNSVPATLVSPGVVRQAGDGELVLRDPAIPGPATASTALARDTFRSAGVPLRLVADLERELWRKALVNAAINPVTALHRVPNGRLLDPPYRDEARRLLREAQRAARVAGFVFEDHEADGDFERVVRSTAQNRSSMLQDVEHGRPTEVDAISGEIVRVARSAGLELSETSAVVDRLRALRPPTAVRAQSS
jgi:2-dehydropantoate 2-reductase